MSCLKSKNKPIFLILLAAYNGKNWLAEQLESILGQRDVEVRLYISVDPSQDGTELFVKRWAMDDQRVNVLADAGRFGSAARNFYRLVRDVEFSHFDYLSFSDQDDIWLPHKLSHAHRMIQEGKYDAYSSNVISFWPDGKERYINKSQPLREYDFLFEAAGPGSTYIFNKKLAQSLQHFVKTHYDQVNSVSLHDWLFYAFSRSHKYSWFIDDNVGLLYRQHETNHLGVNSGFSAYKDRLNFIATGWYHAEITKIFKLCYSDHPFGESLIHRGWRARFFVMCHASQCRRRLSDRIILFLSCLLGLF